MEVHYKTSTDYKRLKDLMLEGKNLVGFVTYDWARGSGNSPMMVTDVVGIYAFNIGYENECLHVGCRGTAFIDYYHKKEWCTRDHTFEDECKHYKLEYIDIN